ncbi:MAG: hypothetical protein Q8941_09025 [Bacteroidota bacterium]|nr:hypothetical protein [Bacteroidota bacterium]
MLNFIKTYILFVGLSSIIVSCNNSGRPVSKEDQKIFARFFQFEPTPDVKNFYYFPDEPGIDPSYWISFECNESTVARVRESLELQPESQPQEGLIGGLNIEPKPWWDTSFIKKSIPFSRQKENTYRYLWYDKDKRKVYFLSFDT